MACAPTHRAPPARDQGWQATGELRYLPLPGLQFSAFVDSGSVQVNKRAWTAEPNRQSLSAFGVGVAHGGAQHLVNVSAAWPGAKAAAPQKPTANPNSGCRPPATSESYPPATRRATSAPRRTFPEENMNKTFALVWSESRSGWVAAGEAPRRRGKPPGALRRVAVAVALMGVVGIVHAQDFPKDGVVKLGAVDFTVDADKKTMRINQKTDKLIIDWHRFDVGAGKHVVFNQPGRESVVLNKVLSDFFSDIRGDQRQRQRILDQSQRDRVRSIVAGKRRKPACLEQACQPRRFS